MVKTKTTGSVKKSNLKRPQVKNERTKNVQCFEEVSAPPVEIDIEFLHNIISAEVAVQLCKMEECEVRNFDYSTEWYWCSQHIKNIINLQQNKHLQAIEKRWNIKQQYTKYLIRSIISSLWLWATAMFLILK